MRYTNETKGRQKVYPDKAGAEPVFLAPGEAVELEEGNDEPRVLDVKPEPKPTE